MGPVFTINSWVTTIVLFVTLNRGLANAVIYKKVGDEVVLSPGSVTAPITSITWKHNLNLAVEWFGVGEADFYPKYRGRCKLNTKTGELTIPSLTLEDSGSFTPEISNNVLEPIEIKFISGVPKPTVSENCDAEKTHCVLTCEGNTTDSEPVTYTWWSGNVKKSETKELIVTKEETEPSFICELKNPVSSERSTEVLNPFISSPTPPPLNTQNDSNSLNGWIVFLVLVLVLVLMAVAGVFICKRITGRFPPPLSALPWFKNNDVADTEVPPDSGSELKPNNGGVQLSSSSSPGNVSGTEEEPLLSDNNAGVQQPSSFSLEHISETETLNPPPKAPRLGSVSGPSPQLEEEIKSDKDESLETRNELETTEGDKAPDDSDDGSFHLAPEVKLSSSSLDHINDTWKQGTNQHDQRNEESTGTKLENLSVTSGGEESVANPQSPASLPINNDHSGGDQESHQIQTPAVSPGPNNDKPVIYHKVGDKVVLSPGSVDAPITSITWKHNSNLVVEWNKGGGDNIDFYQEFKGRCELKTETGELIIKNLTREDSGTYRAEINNRVLNPTEIKFISGVPKPTVSETFDAEKTHCVLTCEGITTDCEPVTYTWWSDDVKKSETKELNITKEDKEPSFICELKNPVSSERSEEVLNPFTSSSITENLSQRTGDKRGADQTDAALERKEAQGSPADKSSSDLSGGEGAHTPQTKTEESKCAQDQGSESAQAQSVDVSNSSDHYGGNTESGESNSKPGGQGTNLQDKRNDDSKPAQDQGSESAQAQSVDVSNSSDHSGGNAESGESNSKPGKQGTTTTEEKNDKSKAENSSEEAKEQVAATNVSSPSPRPSGGEETSEEDQNDDGSTGIKAENSSQEAADEGAADQTDTTSETEEKEGAPTKHQSSDPLSGGEGATQQDQNNAESTPEKPTEKPKDEGSPAGESSSSPPPSDKRETNQQDKNDVGSKSETTEVDKTPDHSNATSKTPDNQRGPTSQEESGSPSDTSVHSDHENIDIKL